MSYRPPPPPPPPPPPQGFHLPKLEVDIFRSVAVDDRFECVCYRCPFQPPHHSFGAFNIKYRRNEKENDEW